MNETMTHAGTPVIELTSAEHEAFLDREVRAAIGMSAAEFRDRVERGEVNWHDPDTFYVAGILGIGQNGHQETA